MSKPAKITPAKRRGVFERAHGSIVSVQDRVSDVRGFGRKECAAALRVPGLQQTVKMAIDARLRFLDRVHLVLHFEDHHQDFLRWYVDKNGKVIECRPFQSSLWCGIVVQNVDQLGKGSTVFYIHTEADGERNIRYPLAKVTKGSAL